MSNPASAPGRRTHTRAHVEALAAKYRTWGHWGPDDELGAANRVTPERIVAAAGLVRRGAVFSLALPMDGEGPMTGRNGRVNPQHVMLRDGGDMAPGDVQGYTDDAVYLPLQASTQWDALCHFFHEGRAYNDRGPESVTSRGAVHNSITGLRDRAIGRGVLLDLPRAAGRPWWEPGEAIQPEDLERCAAVQGVEVREGDFLLVRTGEIARRRAAGGWGDYAGGPAPGLGVDSAEFLCPRGIVGVATDTWGIEAIPYEAPLLAPLHVILLVNAGIYIGEMWDMEELADDCAADGVGEFLLTAPPLTITGAVGSPLNPIAVK
ncbi:cyclase family protein [Pseudonocardia sp. NPDC049154]|uniref:cyclase family protein n=1 Tax=Pseudonocardia sp. NPDC049154 TaxID=3155501 RepID=UPI0034043A91